LVRAPNGLSAIAGLSPGLAALLINLNFFAESMLFLGGRKNKKSLGAVSGNHLLRSCPVSASTQCNSIPEEQPKATQRRWGHIATERGGSSSEHRLR
jgi:hypothetical protein